jgi:hypothetical protein
VDSCPLILVVPCSCSCWRALQAYLCTARGGLTGLLPRLSHLLAAPRMAAVVAHRTLLLVAVVAADVSADQSSPSWPALPSVLRGWAFAYNFTSVPRDGRGPSQTGVAHMYPSGTVNLDTTAPGKMGALAVQEYQRRGILPLGWGYCWDDPWMPHNKNGTAITNRTAAIDVFARYARGSNVTAGVGLDECNKNNAHFPGERELAAEGFRRGKRAGHLIAAWGSNAGDELFASLMADGTFDLAMVEGYTYCPGAGDWPKSGRSCANGGTAHIEQYFDRLDFARAQGYLNRTLFCFGFIQGKSAINPGGWTKSMLHAALVRLKAAYPELRGVIMYGQNPRKGFANATNASTHATDMATVEMIRVANELMLEVYPDP